MKKKSLLAGLLLLVVCSAAMAEEIMFRENYWNDLTNAPLSNRRWNANYGAAATVLPTGDNVQPVCGAISGGNISATWISDPINADPEYYEIWEKPYYGFAFVANLSDSSNPAVALWTEQFNPDLSGVNQSPMPLASTIGKVGWFGNERTGTGGTDIQENFMMKLDGQWYVNTNTITVNGSWVYYTANISLNGSQWKALDFVPGSSLTQDIGALSTVGGTLADGRIQAFGVYIKTGGTSGQTGYWGRVDSFDLYTPEPATMTLLGLGVLGLIRRK
jgi:hypothetical protein